MFLYVWIMTAFMLSFFGRILLGISVMFGIIFAINIIVIMPPMTFMFAVIYCFVSASVLVLFANKMDKDLRKIEKENKDESQ